jgi:hypothetical protein
VGVPFPDDESPPLHAARRDPQLMGNQIEAPYVDFIRRSASRRPVLFVLEDLHWGDAPSVQLLNVALRELADRPRRSGSRGSRSRRASVWAVCSWGGLRGTRSWTC